MAAARVCGCAPTWAQGERRGHGHGANLSLASRLLYRHRDLPRIGGHRDLDQYPRGSMVELGGTWRAAIADDDLRRTWQDDAFDDTGWEAVAVPGHWRSTPAFVDTDGPLLYRRSFEAAGPAEGRRAWLTFDGLFYQGDVWLDGSYLGDTEGYFAPHTFEVSDALGARSEHHLAIEVTCSRPADLTAKRNITGVFQHWDCLDPDWNPGGIWRPVRVTETGPVRIARLRALCREATPERAVLLLRATLDSDAARSVSVHTTIAGVEQVTDHPLATGANDLEWTITIDRPELWWPRALGPPRSTTSTWAWRSMPPRVGPPRTRHLRTGLRQIRLRSWIASVNGERLFLKGSNQGPTRMAIAEATPEELARDVELACEAGLDLLRIHAHITRPELTRPPTKRACCSGRTSRSSGATRGASGSRPCSRRRPPSTSSATTRRSRSGAATTSRWRSRTTRRCGPSRRRSAALALKAAAAQELPTWNKTVLDRSVKRALEKTDGTCPVIAHSGVLPHPPQLDGTDTHLYFGWYHGRERDFPGFLRALPRMARFVTEFGAQAVPTSADFCEPERWPDLDWERLAHTHALQRAVFDRHVPPDDHATFDEWRAATAGVPSGGGAPAHRGAATDQVPPHRRVRPVLLRRRTPRGDVVGAGPRSGAQGRLRRAARGVPAVDRGGRSPP